MALPGDDTRADEDEPAPGVGRAPASGVRGENTEQRGLRAAGQLVARTLATRAISLIGMIALARLLTPAEFGVFAVIQLIVTIITVVGDLGIGSGLVQQHDEPEANDLETVYAVQLALFGSLAVLAAIIAPIAATLLDLGPGSAALAVLMALTLLMVPLRGVPTAMLSRELRFGPLALSEVVQQLAFFVVAIGCAAAGLGVLSFGLAAVVQSIVATVVIWLIWRRRPPRPRVDRAAAGRLWSFGFRMQVAHIAVWGRDALVPLFGGLAGGVEAVGYLQFAWRNGQLITGVDDIVGRVGFPALSRLHHDHKRFARASRGAIGLAAFSAIGVQAWLVVTAPILIPVVFSEQWLPAVPAFQLVAVGAAAGTVSSVLRAGLNAAGQSDRAMRGASAGLAVTAVLFPVGLILGGVTGGGWAFLLSSLVTLLVNVRLTTGLVRVPWLQLIRIVAIGLAAAVPAGLTAQANPDLLGLAISGGVYVATFGLLAALVERDLLRNVLSIIRRPDSVQDVVAAA